MHPLNAHQILQVWELARSQHPVDRALNVLTAACPGMTRDGLAALSVGQRDALLLALREKTFGGTLNAFAQCPRCRAQLEFAISTADIRVTPETPVREEQLELVVENLVLRFRLPNSFDLAAISGCEDVATARRLLLQRCLVQASREGISVSYGDLSEETIAGLAVRMADCDPQAEVMFDFECQACSHRWQLTFDVESFFWVEISMEAKRLLREVHILARAYGWREADVLSMSPDRRRSYLELV